MLKKVTRTISLALREGKRTHGFLEMFILADTAYVYSLQGSGLLKDLTTDRLEEIMNEAEVSRIEFIMEPKVFNIIKSKDLGFQIIRKLNYYDIDLLWVLWEKN